MPSSDQRRARKRAKRKQRSKQARQRPTGPSLASVVAEIRDSLEEATAAFERWEADGTEDEDVRDAMRAVNEVILGVTTLSTLLAGGRS